MKKKILMICLSVVGAIFLLVNLAWLVFVCRCIQLRDRVQFDRTRQKHYYRDFDENIYYCGFELDTIEYLNFHAQGQISMPFVNYDAADELFVHYTFLKGYSYTYIYYLAEDVPEGAIPKDERYEMHFNSEGELLYEGDYDKYEEFADRIQDLIEKADAMWGLR